MGNDLPGSISEMVSAISVGSDLGVMLLNNLKDFEGSPQDLLMVTTEENWEFREELAEAIYVGRFEHRVNKHGYHFLRPRRTVTVSEARAWLAGSPYQPRLGSGDMICGEETLDDKGCQLTVFLGAKPYLAIYTEDWDTGKPEVLSHVTWQEESKITLAHYIPIDYKATPKAFHRVLAAWPIWQNKGCEFLLEHTHSVSISVYLDWLEQDGLRPANNLDLDRLPGQLRYWLGPVYDLAFPKREVLCLDGQHPDYPTSRLGEREIFGHIPATSSIPAGMLTLVKTKLHM